MTVIVAGKPDAKAKLQVTCSVVPADDGPAPQAAGPPPPPPAPPSGGSAASATVQGGQRPGLPLNFDIRNYPGETESFVPELALKNG